MRTGLILPIGASLAALLTVFAARSDVGRGFTASDTVLDLTVGLAFIAAGAGLRADVNTRALVYAVGVGWLLASVWSAWGGLHQSLLALALATWGGLHRWWVCGILVAALPVAVGSLLEQAVAVLFFVVAALLLLLRRPPPIRTRIAAMASALVAVSLSGRWLITQTWPSWYDPRTTLAIYEIVLIVVALALLVESRGTASTAEPLTSRLLAGVDATGVEGLSVLLAQTLRDPALRVLAPDVHLGTGKALSVDDGGERVAVVSYRSAPLDDPSTAASVAAAVRLTLAHERLLGEQEEQLARLVAARARIVAATDRQRALAAAALRQDVRTLDQVGRRVAAVSDSGTVAGMTDLLQALSVVGSELAGASREILGMVEGVPPTDLGEGRLQIELAALAERAPMRVHIVVTDEVAADAASEAVAYYVCAEGLTNAAKHADASEVVIGLRLSRERLVVSVRDDGRGGAVRSGSGLQGLSDRVAAVGGRFRVASSGGVGTLLVASLPLSQSGSMARSGTQRPGRW